MSTTSSQSHKSISASILSKSLTNKSEKRAKTRPYIVWNAERIIQVLVTSTFDDIDAAIQTFQCRPLSKKYLLDRLLVMSTKAPLNGRQSTTAKPLTNRPVTIVDTYVILTPVNVDQGTAKWNKFIPEYFDENV